MTVRPRPTPPVPSSPFAAVDFWVKIGVFVLALAAVIWKGGAIQYQVEHGADLLAWQLAELAKQEATHYEVSQQFRTEMQQRISRIEAQRERR